MSQKSHSIIKISSLDDFEKFLLEGPVIVNITASWCGACRFFDSTVNKLSKEYSNIKFLKIDLDEAEEAMPDLIEHVSNVPHFDLYHDGIKISEYCGSKADQLKFSIEKFKSKIDLVDDSTSNDQTLDDSNIVQSESGENIELEKNSHQDINLENQVSNSVLSIDKSIKDSKNSEFLEEKSLKENVVESKSVVTIFDSEQFKQLISEMVSIVYIHDPSCSLSVYISPLFNKIADENPDIKFLKIHADIAKQKMIVELEHVCATPHFDLYKNGKKIQQYCGADEIKLNEAVLLLKKLLLNKSNDVEIPFNDSNSNEDKKKVSNLILINSFEEFKEKTLIGSSLVHYSADWCRPSLSIQPILENLASLNESIKFVQVNFDKAKLFMSDDISHIASIPYFELFFDGEKIGEFLGDNIVKLKKSVKLLSSKINQN